MSSLVTCRIKNEFDRYATAKSGGEFLLTVALVADVVLEIVELVNNKDMEHFTALLVLASISLGLQVVAIILAIILACLVYPAKTIDQVDMEAPQEGARANKPASPPRAMRAMNDLLTVIAGVLMVLHIIRKAIQGTLSPSDVFFKK